MVCQNGLLYGVILTHQKTQNQGGSAMRYVVRINLGGLQLPEFILEEWELTYLCGLLAGISYVKIEAELFDGYEVA